MQLEETLKQLRDRFGLTNKDIKQLLAGDLGQMLIDLQMFVVKEASTFTKQIDTTCKAVRVDWSETSPDIFNVVVDEAWREEYSKFMAKRVFDAFVAVARQELLPKGLTIGHYRTPTVSAALAGKSGNALQDLIMIFFEESVKGRK